VPAVVRFLGENETKGRTLTTRPTAEDANRRPKCKARKDSSGVILCWDWPMAKRRMRGKNMRAHDQDIKLDFKDQDCQMAYRTDSRTTTNMPDAAQVQEAVVPSLKSSAFVVSGTGPGSTEASSELEDARRLSDKSSSSTAEDMREEWCSWEPPT
jgi:hypothetical protein